MPSLILVYRRRSDVARAFREVTSLWGLSASEAAALAGTSMPPVRPTPARQVSEFVLERMALTVEIDALLTGMMERFEIPEWLRRRVPGVLESCPLDEMFGSTDRIRRVRDLLEPEVRQ